MIAISPKYFGQDTASIMRQQLEVAAHVVAWLAGQGLETRHVKANVFSNQPTVEIDPPQRGLRGHRGLKGTLVIERVGFRERRFYTTTVRYGGHPCIVQWKAN